MQGPIPAASEQELPRKAERPHACSSPGGREDGTCTRNRDQEDASTRTAVSTRPAVPAPERTDFIGCGDYAAAGLAHALIHGLDIASTVNEFITRKLQANVL